MYPEILIAVMASVILIADVFLHAKLKQLSYWLALFSLLAVASITVWTMPTVATSLFDNAFIIDRFASMLKLTIYVLLGCIYLYARFYINSRKFLNGEFFSLSLFSLLGMMIIISSGNFLSLYLGLELVVLPLYVLIVMVKDQARYAEAAMKYFIIGSLGSGLFLYGISFVFGATGSFSFTEIATNSPYLGMEILGMLLIVAGIAVEFGAAPFHTWLPDVYEGSPTPVTMLIGTLPKIAVFAMVYRILTMAFADLFLEWQQIMLVLALISIAWGNIAAIAQSNIKRMLAYSTVGHIGFILLALFAAPTQGYIPAIFYTISYTVMALVAFAVILRLSDQGFEADEIHDFAALHQRAPWVAFIMLLTMFSLAGIPPLLGFYAKLLVLQTVVAAGFTWIAVAALIFSVIGAFFYLRVIRIMYFEPVSAAKPLPSNNMSFVGQGLISINGLLLLILGIFPGVLIYWCIYSLQ